MSKDALSKAIDLAGGQSALARELGLSQSTVYAWLKTTKKGVPGEFCPAIEALTGVPRHELRPDVYAPIRKRARRSVSNEAAA